MPFATRSMDAPWLPIGIPRVARPGRSEGLRVSYSQASCLCQVLLSSCETLVVWSLQQYLCLYQGSPSGARPPDMGSAPPARPPLGSRYWTAPGNPQGLGCGGPGVPGGVWQLFSRAEHCSRPRAPASSRRLCRLRRSRPVLHRITARQATGFVVKLAEIRAVRIREVPGSAYPPGCLFFAGRGTTPG